VVQLPPGVDRDTAVEAMRERGVDTKPYLPAIHLMSFYRERFGHREGEFPVCEEVAARSLALPFFGELTDGELEQVVGALRAVIEAQRSGLTSATKPGSPRPAGR
jgi:perosamine synthetase